MLVKLVVTLNGQDHLCINQFYCMKNVQLMIQIIRCIWPSKPGACITCAFSGTRHQITKQSLWLSISCISKRLLRLLRIPYCWYIIIAFNKKIIILDKFKNHDCKEIERSLGKTIFYVTLKDSLFHYMHTCDVKHLLQKFMFMCQIDARKMHAAGVKYGPKAMNSGKFWTCINKS